MKLETLDALMDDDLCAVTACVNVGFSGSALAGYICGGSQGRRTLQRSLCSSCASRSLRSRCIRLVHSASESSAVATEAMRI